MTSLAIASTQHRMCPASPACSAHLNGIERPAVCTQVHKKELKPPPEVVDAIQGSGGRTGVVWPQQRLQQVRHAIMPQGVKACHLHYSRPAGSKRH